MSVAVPLTFFLAGFSKCGTTTLSAMLHRHPHIALPSMKEPWFFTAPLFHQRWEWFRGLYPKNLSTFTAIGDDTNEYSAHHVVNEVAPRLVDLYPKAKFLFLARDPVARIESAYRQNHDIGTHFGLMCPYDLADAMNQIPAIKLDANYWTSLSVYRDLVPPERIKVIHLEDLVDSPATVMSGVFEYLGVDPSVSQQFHETMRLNVSDSKYYDTKLLRSLRTNRVVGPFLARFVHAQQEKVNRPLKLRRKFRPGHRPEWTPGAIEVFNTEVLPGAKRFANEYGLPVRGWKRTAELTGFGG